MAGDDASFPNWRPQLVAIGGSSRFAFEQAVRGAAAGAGRSYVVAYTGSGDIVPSLRLVTQMPVVAIATGATPQADRVYVVPPGSVASLDRGAFVLAAPSADHTALDVLFRSLGDELGADATCVVLSGAGADGALGIKRVKESDGLVLVQSPTDAEDPHMPLAAIETGCADVVCPASEISSRLSTLTPIDGETLDDDHHHRRDAAADALRDILTLVRIRTGHDFSQYKRPTLYRRIARRMQVCEAPTLGDYHRYLRDHSNELAHLMRDFLISVTNFFRDAESFDVLAKSVIPKLFAGKTAGDQVRVWVAGCATGEEAYSIGMLLLEHASQLASPPSIQMFATDIDDAALTDARAGRYNAATAVDVTPERLARFFIHEGPVYRVTKELREIILFSPHNLLRDPPFSRLDLVSCRNILIYLSREAQDRVLALFHFALRPDGTLFLGSSESAEAAANLFGPLDAKLRLFARRTSTGELTAPALLSSGRWQARAVPPAMPAERGATSFGELHHRIVEHYAPPSVIVNDELDVLHMSAHAGRYMQVAGGEPTRQLLRLVEPALGVDLRSALYSARQGNGEQVRHVRYEHSDGEPRAVALRVRPVTIQELGSGLLLVLFDELGVSAAQLAASSTNAIEPVVRELEDDLQHMRDQLRTSVEQYETSLEELKASNEELQAINEELRSATEELETSREELQSVNEELTTLNHELKIKVDEVSHANSDLQNLMTSTDIAVLFLDRSLNIKRFTRRSLDLFNLIPSDVGRPFAHVTHQLATDDLGNVALDVLQSLRVVEREVTTRAGDPFLVRVLPYRSLEDRIDGVVMTFFDIGELRRAEAALRVSDLRFRLALSVAPAIATTRDTSGTCTWAYALGHELPPATNFEHLLAPDEARRLATLEAEARSQRASRQIELALHVDGEARMFDTHVEPILDDGKLTGLITVGYDITASKNAELAMREIDRRKDEFIATLSHELRNPLTPLRVALDVQKLQQTGDNAPAQRTHAIMERQVDQLIALVDDLLDVSRIAQGKLDLTRDQLDLRDVLTSAIEDTRSLAESVKHRVSLVLPDAPLPIDGNRGRLVQVFVNLVTNACKYTPDSGAITISAGRDDARDRIVVTVRDNGLGLAAGQAEQMFELFAQSRDARGRARGGLGIGLNLVRRLVEMHGGEVRAESDGLGTGSVFTVELPIAG